MAGSSRIADDGGLARESTRKDAAVRADGARSVVITTPRLVVTTWLPGDVDDLLELHADPETMRFVRAGRPESRAEVEALVEQYVVEQATRGWTKWRVADHDGRLVGRAGFGGTDAVRGLAYLIRRDR